METETQEISTSFLSKPTSDLTVADSLKMALVVSAIVAVTPIAVKAASDGVKTLYRKLRKTDRKIVEVPKIADKK